MFAHKLKKVILREIATHHIRIHHPWIYRSQVLKTENGPAPGDLVHVWTHKGSWIGQGYYNPDSEIVIRLLTKEKETIDKTFFVRKLTSALELRKRYVDQTNAYRIVASEADDLPGLMIDRYNETLVVQFLTLGMDCLRPVVLEAIEQAIPHKGVFEKSDSGSRAREGLPQRVEWITKGASDRTIVYEQDVEFIIEFGKGHKTALYLDQRENRFLLRSIIHEKHVLDAFCHEGGFALHLAKSRCHVLGIDIQPEAIERACLHRAHNHIDESQLQFKIGNAFDLLKELAVQKKLFDAVILDPPSFAQRKTALEGALGGYKEIILRSMKLLKNHGLLAVFSCSYHIDLGLLMSCCLEAASDTRKSLRVIKFMKQSSDHPINPLIPETYYLKGALLEINSLP